jgi:hypothetical protein
MCCVPSYPKHEKFVEWDCVMGREWNTYIYSAACILLVFVISQTGAKLARNRPRGVQIPTVYTRLWSLVFFIVIYNYLQYDQFQPIKCKQT